MEENNNSNGAIKFGLIGLGVGLAAGAVAGILLAPKSGKETRMVIVEKANETKEGAVSKFKKAEKDVRATEKKVKKTTKAAKKELKK